LFWLKQLTFFWFLPFGFGLILKKIFFVFFFG
jgi:hypothetical protein